MDELREDLRCLLDNYFTILTKIGYVKDGEVFKLLVYMFIILHVLNGEFQYYVSEEDYKNIYKALNCLWGTTCLIPYPTWKKGALKRSFKTGTSRYRISEDRILRSLEEDISILRVPEENNSEYVKVKKV